MAGAVLIGAAQDSGADFPLPAAGDVVSAYRTLRGWVDAFGPPGTRTTEARVALADAGGVCVLLRRSGRVVGTGVDTTGDELALRRAAGRALGEVLGDPAVAGLPEEIRDTIGPSLVVELEVAGAPVPVLGRTFAEVAARLDPGRDGIAIRRGADWAMLFPAQMRATNTAGAIDRMLPGLATKLGLTPMGLADLTRLHDISVYRFRTIHLAQVRPDRAPFETFRGEVLVIDADVSTKSIAALADAIADYLMRLRWSREIDPVGVMGTYQPVADRYQPLLAPPVDQALVALALGRYARVPGLDPDKSQRAAAAGHEVFHELRRIAPGESDPLESAVACAAIVLAAHELGQLDPDCRRLFNMASGSIRNAFSPKTGFVERDPETGETHRVGSHGSALIAAGLARQLHSGVAGVSAEFARQAIDSAWETTSPHQHISLLPWLGWAEIDYADATEGPVVNADRLRHLRDLLDESRYGTPGRAAPDDLWGAFALEAASQRPIGDAQTLRPAAWLALMLRDPRLTDPDQAGLWLGRHLKTVRFLMQLTVQDSSLWAYRAPERARGGVREAPWSRDMPVAAQVVGLLTAAETLTSLKKLASRSRGTP